MSENQITTEIAEIILGVVNNPEHPRLKDLIVKEHHISRRMLTPAKLLHLGGITFFRLMMAIAQNVAEKEYNLMLNRMREATLNFAELEDGSPEALMQAHAGSPIKKKH